MDSPPISGRRSSADDDIAVDSSFTALLALPSNQALQLLHKPSAAAGELWRIPHAPLDFPPTFPSDAALVDRAARHSAFAVAAGEESGASSSGAGHTPPLKAEQSDGAIFPADRRPRRSVKRKEGEKLKGTEKKRRNAEKINGGGNDEVEKLPYVHVRARRGQATNSHSLAERARREKINARMKLLQELVPGCSKISGTALVLDEIINHVQFLQRQVELLSMRLAAVNPRVDFTGFDNFLPAEWERAMAWGNNAWPFSDFTINGHQHTCYLNSMLPFIPSTALTPTHVQCSPPRTPSLTTN